MDTGFLISDRPLDWIQGDIYIPAESASKAMHGDRVIVRIARVDRDKRADGEIVRVLKRAHATVVGEFRIRRRGNFCRAARRSHSTVDSRFLKAWKCRTPRRCAIVWA